MISVTFWNRQSWTHAFVNIWQAILQHYVYQALRNACSLALPDEGLVHMYFWNQGFSKKISSSCFSYWNFDSYTLTHLPAMLHDVPLFHKISVSATLSIHYWFPRIDLQTKQGLEAIRDRKRWVRHASWAVLDRIRSNYLNFSCPKIHEDYMVGFRICTVNAILHP